ncbi:hypothetical protein EDB89DRAFT_1910906 [Lactarius sanguifluus]|nr:hypothetical protein EDB89DRAFT_1910906 [Lactarius sanguifluus]
MDEITSQAEGFIYLHCSLEKPSIEHPKQRWDETWECTLGAICELPMFKLIQCGEVSYVQISMTNLATESPGSRAWLRLSIAQAELLKPIKTGLAVAVLQIWEFDRLRFTGIWCPGEPHKTSSGRTQPVFPGIGHDDLATTTRATPAAVGGQSTPILAPTTTPTTQAATTTAQSRQRGRRRSANNRCHYDGSGDSDANDNTDANNGTDANDGMDVEMSTSDTHEYKYSSEFSEERLVLDLYSLPLSLSVSSRTVVVVGHCRGGLLGAGVGLSSSGGWPLAGPTAIVIYQGRTVVAASSHVHSQQYHHQQQQDGARDDNDAMTTTEQCPNHCNGAMPVDHDHGSDTCRQQQRIPVDCDNWATRTTSTDDNNNRGDPGCNVQGDQEGDALTTMMGATMTRRRQRRRATAMTVLTRTTTQKASLVAL